MTTIRKVTPQETRSAVDPDIAMAPPLANQPGSPTTPTQTPRAQGPIRNLPNGDEVPPPKRTNTPLSSSATFSISARLEEVETETSTFGGNPTRNPTGKYSPGPMPPIQDSSPTSIFEHIDISLIKEWESRPGGKLIAVPFDNDVMTPETHEFIRNRILTAAAEILNAQEVSVAAPRPSAEARKRGRTPISFLIYNITTDQADTLLLRGVWSSKAITFRTAPFTATCPSYFFAIKGFGTITTREIYPIVKNVWDSEETKNFIDTLTNDVPPSERANVSLVFENLINSVYLARLDTKDAGNTLAPRFNVYADSTDFPYDKLWSRLRTFLHGRAYTSLIEDESKTEKTPFRCTCCHGVDHPRGLCPFPSLIGWNGPKKENGGIAQRRNGGPANFGQRTNRQRYAPY